MSDKTRMYNDFRGRQGKFLLQNTATILDYKGDMLATTQWRLSDRHIVYISCFS